MSDSEAYVKSLNGKPTAKIEDSSALLDRLFKTVTRYLPDAPLSERSDLTVSLYEDVVAWGNPGVDMEEIHIDEFWALRPGAKFREVNTED